MTGPERDFADQVFQDRVPDDRVLLTNLTGIGGRAFTCPGPGGVVPNGDPVRGRALFAAKSPFSIASAILFKKPAHCGLWERGQVWD